MKSAQATGAIRPRSSPRKPPARALFEPPFVIILALALLADVFILHLRRRRGAILNPLGGVKNMNLFGPVLRAVALAGVLVSALAMPAIAADSPEIAALKEYLGTWSGKGVISGGQQQDVSCKMSLNAGNGGKLNYTGRCSLGGAQLSITGTIAWVDANNRYEAVMNSGIGGFRGVAIGKRSGGNIVFDLKQRADDDEGNDISIASKVVLSGNKINVDFQATFNDSGDTIYAKVPFSKA
jgi:hypothetical protein